MYYVKDIVTFWQIKATEGFLKQIISYCRLSTFIRLLNELSNYVFKVLY